MLEGQEAFIRIREIPPASVRWEAHFYDEYDQENFHPYTGEVEHLEPAPPKDWKPLCFNIFTEEGNEICGYNKAPQWEECQECIYRKKE